MRKILLSVLPAPVMVPCLAPMTAFVTEAWTEVSTAKAVLGALENGGNVEALPRNS